MKQYWVIEYINEVFNVYALEVDVEDFSDLSGYLEKRKIPIEQVLVMRRVPLLTVKYVKY